MARVYDYTTGDDLGEATAELARASEDEASGAGAIGAYKNDAGVWIHAPEGSWAPWAKTVYVAE